MAMRKEQRGMEWASGIFMVSIFHAREVRVEILHQRKCYGFKNFKEKYFPDVLFLDAKLGHNPSFIWLSIHASQIVVKEGIQWKLGSGHKIHV